jgi:succinate dehydrogenase hydrophobic anchor subunit
VKTLSFVSLVFAVVCFAVAAFIAPPSAPPSPWYARLNNAGLAFFAASFLLAALPHS